MKSQALTLVYQKMNTRVIVTGTEPTPHSTQRFEPDKRNARAHLPRRAKQCPRLCNRKRTGSTGTPARWFLSAPNTANAILAGIVPTYNYCADSFIVAQRNIDKALSRALSKRFGDDKCPRVFTSAGVPVRGRPVIRRDLGRVIGRGGVPSRAAPDAAGRVTVNSFSCQRCSS
ncbi:hypothetical protein EVAR_15715_1 [Eumeta japonica]|uniref:Uncharacterized protein n=1 Tax=Eumeta variegata TaxID=151549 RepID=A0A4C1U9K0_EUMVA|nr:hypothetical protein EVAR_15715_1 [Eumeta japonica]